jgi:uridine kinase
MNQYISEPYVILPAGEVMEPALASVCKDVRLGKILIQTNQSTGEPELHYLRLPKNIHECHVFLMEATVATGEVSGVKGTMLYGIIS